MKPRRPQRRRAFLSTHAPLSARAIDAREVARFLRHQPPVPVPPRSLHTGLSGLIGLSVLGYRIIRRLD